jgi:hypothetical protein
MRNASEDRDHDRYDYIPLDLLETPTDYATCRLNMWWLVEPGRGALVLRHGRSYQCHNDKALLEYLRDGRLLDIVFIPIAYLPPRSDF